MSFLMPQAFSLYPMTGRSLAVSGMAGCTDFLVVFRALVARGFCWGNGETESSRGLLLCTAV